MPYLESISPSRSKMLEDNTHLDGETPLTESGKERLVTYGWLLAMASKSVGCSPFLPTTESDSSIERERESESDIQRVRA